MKDIKTNRFLVWLMWLVPIACTGWLSVIIWTVIQLILCDKESEKERECEIIREHRKEIQKKKQEENIQYQIELAKQFGKKYYIIDGKVHMFDGK